MLVLATRKSQREGVCVVVEYVFSSFTIYNKNMLSMYSLIYPIINIHHAHLIRIFFINTLRFIFDGVMIMLLHDFHENTFYPK